MKRWLFLLIAAAPSASAQTATEPYRPAPARELPRTELTTWATEAEAAAAPASSKYVTPLTEWEQSDGSFRTTFTRPFLWAARQVILRVDRASSGYRVLVNGRPVETSTTGSLPGEFNLTRFAQEGMNTLAIDLLPSSPLEGRAASAPRIEGVCLLSPPTIRVRDLYTAVERVADRNEATIGVVVKSDALNAKRAKIHYALVRPDGSVADYGMRDIELRMRGEDTLRFVTSLPDSMLWSSETPVLYSLRLKTQTDGRFTEYADVRIGFAERKPQKAGVPSRENHTPLVYNPLEEGVEPIERFLNECDRTGRRVVVYAPVDTHAAGSSRAVGGNPSNDRRYCAEFVARAEQTYHIAKRHPSVVGFSIAAADSANGICLYESYLRLKSICHDRPVLYPWARGEWNTDRRGDFASPLSEESGEE